MLPVSLCFEKIILKIIMQKDVAKKPQKLKRKVNNSKDVNVWFYRLEICRLQGKLHGEMCSGVENHTEGARQAFLSGKTSIPEQREAPQPPLLSRKPCSYDLEATLTQHGWCQKGQCPPPPVDKLPPGSASNHGKVVQAGRALRHCQPKQGRGLSPSGN